MVGLLSRHKGKSVKTEFCIIFDTLSLWANEDPVEIWWQRGSHSGKLKPVQPSADGVFHIGQTIRLDATLFKDPKSGQFASKPMSLFIRPVNAKSKPKAGSDPLGTIDLADHVGQDGECVAIPIHGPGSRQPPPVLHVRIFESQDKAESGGGSSAASPLTPRSEYSGIAAVQQERSSITIPGLGSEPSPQAPPAAQHWRPVASPNLDLGAPSEKSMGSAMSSASSGAALAAAAATVPSRNEDFPSTVPVAQHLDPDAMEVGLTTNLAEPPKTGPFVGGTAASQSTSELVRQPSSQSQQTSKSTASSLSVPSLTSSLTSRSASHVSGNGTPTHKLEPDTAQPLLSASLSTGAHSGLLRASPFSSGHSIPSVEVPQSARIPGFGEAVAGAATDINDSEESKEATTVSDTVNNSQKEESEMLAPRSRRFGRTKEPPRRWAWQQQEQQPQPKTHYSPPVENIAVPVPEAPSPRKEVSQVGSSGGERTPRDTMMMSSRSSKSPPTLRSPTPIVESPANKLLPRRGGATTELACVAALESAIYLVAGSGGIQPGLSIPGWYKPARRLARTLCTLQAPHDLGFAWEMRAALSNALLASNRDLDMLVLWASNIRQLLWMLADASGKPMVAQGEDAPAQLWAGLLPALFDLGAQAERGIVSHLWRLHVLPEAKRAGMQKETFRTWDASPTAATAPEENPAVGYWCAGLEAALEALNSLSYPPWSRTQSLALHARIMPALLHKLDVFLVDGLLINEGPTPVARKDRLLASESEVQDRSLPPSLSLLPEDSYQLLASNAGVTLKLAASTLTEWAAGNALVPLSAASDLFPMLCSAANLLMVPEEVLHDRGVVRELSAGLPADLVAGLLAKFGSKPSRSYDQLPNSMEDPTMTNGDGQEVQQSKADEENLSSFMAFSPDSMLQKGLVEPLGVEMDSESDHELEELEQGGSVTMRNRFRLLRELWTGQLIE